MGQTIGVRLKDGDYRKVRWSGFLSREHAANLEGAKSVKLQVTDYTLNHNMSPDWVKVPKDEFLQGCLVPTARGTLKAYGVVKDGIPVIVSEQLKMFA